MEREFKFISKFNEVQATMNLGVKIDFPQMVVVGGQSDGKSSLLESIVGRRFLPRGEGIVTRTPTILQLHYCEPDQGEWAEIEYDGGPNSQKVDFAQVENLISTATVKLAGAEKGVVNRPIIVKLFSPSLHDLTLVDLPGLVEVPLASQAPDIAQQIESLVKNYILNENAIILAVHQATADIATSKALKMVMDADPEGKRTVFVLTKLDLIPDSVDKSSLLSGEALSLVQNMKVKCTIGVINKHGQEDFRTAEKKFFDDPRYKKMRHQHGIDYLVGYLSNRFRDHIHNKMPSLRAKIDNEIEVAKEEMKKLVENLPLHVDDQSADQMALEYVREVLQRFCTFLVRSIDGDVNLRGDRIRGGAKLQILFNDGYRERMEKIKVLEGKTEEEVAIQITNAIGAEPGIFLTTKAFRQLVQVEMSRMLDESLTCSDQAYQEMLAMRDDAATLQMKGTRKRYPELYAEIQNLVRVYLDSLRSTTKQRVEEFVMMQSDYINVKHPSFAAAKKEAERKNAEIIKTSQPSTSVLFVQVNVDTKENKEVEVIKELTNAYFDVIRLIIIDSVPKVIMKFMISEIKNNLQLELLKALSTPAQIRPLMKENEFFVNQRNELEARLAKLLDVADKLKELASP